MTTAAKTAAGRYASLSTIREPYLKRARECAELTIPSLLPKSGHGAASDLPTPYQGMGARGVNNLASKLLMALVPPNQSMFRLMLDDFALEQLAGSSEVRSEVEKSLGQIERTVQVEFETTGTRLSVFEGLKQTIVAGNVLLYVRPEGGLKVYRLDRYVVKRDPMGNLLEIVTHEKVSPLALPEEFRKAIELDDNNRDNSQDTIDIYTWVRREGDMFKISQEVKNKLVPGSEGEYPVDKSPWLALRWVKLDGEDYGRGHVEEYLGDLRSDDGLNKAIVEGSAAAAKVLILVNPNGTTNEKTISEAPNCAVRAGNKDDVTVLGLEKFADFRVALETIARIEQRLAQAFLLTASVQRDAERVTAEEIRLMAGELEDALGGVYSILAQEFQLPYVKRVMFQMEKDGRLPVLPEGLVRPSIITGMEALGRGHDLNRLMTFGQMVNTTLGPQAFAAVIKPNDFVLRLGTALGLEMDGLVKTAEEMAAEQQQAQRQQLMQQLGPEAVRVAQQQGGQNVPQA